MELPLCEWLLLYFLYYYLSKSIVRATWPFHIRQQLTSKHSQFKERKRSGDVMWNGGSTMRPVVQDPHTSILADLGMEHRALSSLVMCFTKVSGLWSIRHLQYTHLKYWLFNDILMERDGLRISRNTQMQWWQSLQTVGSRNTSCVQQTRYPELQDSMGRCTRLWTHTFLPHACHQQPHRKHNNAFF